MRNKFCSRSTPRGCFALAKRLAGSVVFAAAFLGLQACSNSNAPGQKLANAGNLTESERSEVVARIGSKNITLDEFERSLNAQAPFTRARYTSLERKREYLDGLVRFELLVEEARKQGLEHAPEVELARKQAMVRLLSKKVVDEASRSNVITDEQVKDYYNSHLAEFQPEPTVEAAHIQLLDEAEATEVLEELQKALEGQDLDQRRAIFMEYARARSRDVQTRDRRGYIGLLPRPQKNEDAQPADNIEKLNQIASFLSGPIVEAAYALNADGEISKPVVAPDGVHLIMRLSLVQAYSRSLEQVAPAIRNKLLRLAKTQAMERRVEELRKSAKIEINEALLEKITVLSPRVPSTEPLQPLDDPTFGIPH